MGDIRRESESVGFVCTRQKCSGSVCFGTHYDLYITNRGGRVPIIIDGAARYIAPEGFNAYYQYHTQNLSMQAHEMLKLTPESFPSETIIATTLPPAKRRKLNME